MIELQHKISVYPLSPLRLNDLKTLFYQVFQKRHTIEYLAHKYNTDYSNFTYGGGHLAYFNSEPIAFTGLIPMPFVMDGKPFSGAQVCDYMTLEPFRRKGVQNVIWKKNEEWAQSHHVDFLFGLFQGVQAIDRTWQANQTLKAYVIPLRNYKFKALLNKLRPGDFRNPENLIQRSGFNILSNKESLPVFQKEDIMQVNYHSEFLKYKSFTSSIKFTCEDIYYWLKFRNVLEVGLLDSSSENKIGPGLNQLIKLAEKSQCSKLIFQVTPDSELDKILAGQYNTIDGFEVMAKILNKDLILKKLHLNLCDMDTF